MEITLYTFDHNRIFTGEIVRDSKNRITNSTDIKPADGMNFFSDSEWRYKNPDSIPSQIQTLNISDINITNSNKVGSIYWIEKGVAFEITAECPKSTILITDDNENPILTNMIVMAERVINGSQVVDDARFIASVGNGSLSITATFDVSGNYIISQKRINEGLQRIGAPWVVSIEGESIEFDVYS